MLTNEQLILICVGFIPYFVKKQQTKEGYALEVRALFWSVQYTTGRLWLVRVPLIERLRQGIWTVIMQMRDGDNSEGNHSQE